MCAALCNTQELSTSVYDLQAYTTHTLPHSPEMTISTVFHSNDSSSYIAHWLFLARLCTFKNIWKSLLWASTMSKCMFKSGEISPNIMWHCAFISSLNMTFHTSQNYVIAGQSFTPSHPSITTYIEQHEACFTRRTESDWEKRLIVLYSL